MGRRSVSMHHTKVLGSRRIPSTFARSNSRVERGRSERCSQWRTSGSFDQRTQSGRSRSSTGRRRTVAASRTASAATWALARSPLIVLAQDGHHEAVHGLPEAEAMAPQQPFPYEAALLVAADAAKVVLIGLQHDASQPHLLEGVAQHLPHGLGAVAAAPEVLLADGDAQCGAAVGL